REGIGVEILQEPRLQELARLYRIAEILPADVLAVGAEERPLEEALEDVGRALLELVVGQTRDRAAVEVLPQRQRQPLEPGVGLARPEAVVPHEDLIAAIAAQADFHVAARLGADEHERQVRGIGGRLIEMPYRALNHGRIDGLHEKLGMAGMEMLGDLARILELAEGGLAIAESERLKSCRHRAAEEAHDRTRVDTAREEGAERDIAHGVIGARTLQEVRQRLLGGLDLLRLERPIARETRASSFDGEEAARKELP